MLQVFRLVTPGRVDRMIAFEELPRRFLSGIKKRDESMTRGIREWLRDKGVMDSKVIQVRNHDTGDMDKIEIKTPFTYVLDIAQTNQDKERWQEIVGFIRRVVDPNVRLLDKVEDMAVPMAPDSNSEMTIEPEQIVIIPVHAKEEHPSLEMSPLVERAESKADEVVIKELKRKRGRPKKEVQEVASA